MLKQRVITGVSLIVFILVALFAFPPDIFQYMVVAVFALAAWEWAQLASLKKQLFRVLYALTVAALLLWLINFTGLNKPYYLGINTDYVRDVFGAGCTFWAIALLWVLSYPASSVVWGSALVRGLMGFLVLVPAAMALMYIKGLNDGQWYFLYVGSIVVVADSCAYFAGKQWGKKKLAAKVSPGKSWAGFFGGLAGCVVLALMVSGFFSVVSLSTIQLIIVTLITGLASVLGDLLESMMKRHSGIKDSSNILPGHGGILDRIDSVCAAAPVFVLLSILL